MLRGLPKLIEKASWDDVHHHLAQLPPRSEILTRPSGWGEWTPLHIACKRDPPINIILSLIESASSAAATFDSFHRLPLHHAAERGTSPDVLYALYGAYAEGITEVDVGGRTPLHLCLMATSRSLSNNTILGNNTCNTPKSATCTALSTTVNPPIPSSRRNSIPNRDEIEILLDDEGVVARTIDNWGNLPLHYACEATNYDNAPIYEDILRTLVRRYVPSILEPNAEGLLPIHIALLKSAPECPPSVNVVKILMVLNEVAKVADKTDGRLALHCACCIDASYDVLKEIVLRYEEACRIPTADREGLLPLEILESMRPPPPTSGVPDYGIAEDTDTTREEWDAFNRKSDFLFSYHPDIFPFATEPARLMRFHKRIVRDVQRTKNLSAECKRVWTWMCSSTEGYVSGEGEEGILMRTVASILQCLDWDDARALAALKTDVMTADDELKSESEITDEGEPIHRLATPEIGRLLRSYLRFADKYEFIGSDNDGHEVIIVVDGSSTPTTVPACDDDLLEPRSIQLTSSVIVERSETHLTLRAYDFPEEEHDRSKRGLGLSSPRRVLLTFISNREDYLNEMKWPANLTGVVPIVDCYDLSKKSQNKQTPSIEDAVFAKDVRMDVNEWGLAQYYGALVRPEAEATLEALIYEDESIVEEGVDLWSVKRYLRQVGEALLSLHEKGITYEEFDMSSFVNLGDRMMLANLNQGHRYDESYQGEALPLFSTGSLPPEMVVKLTSSEELDRYLRYWKFTSDDSQTARLLLPNDVSVISHYVDSFLESKDDDSSSSLSPSFMDLWERIRCNDILWSKIKPVYSNTNSNESFVVRCFHHVDSTKTSILPYTLLPHSESLTVWRFAQMLYELTSDDNDTLFPINKRNDLTHRDDLMTIHSWDEDEKKLMEYDNISDPLARDLLRHTLTPLSKKRYTLNQILSHPFFSITDPESHELKEASHDILRNEELHRSEMEQERQRQESELKQRDEDEAQRKKDEEWLNSRTSTVLSGLDLNDETRLKLRNSCGSQWSKLLQSPSSTPQVPTAIVILPSPLHQQQTSLSTTTTLGYHLGHILALTSLTTHISQKTTKTIYHSSKHVHRLAEYSHLNRTALAYAETNVVDICTGILTRVTHAKRILTDVLSDITSPFIASLTARILIQRTIHPIVSLSSCSHVSSAASSTSNVLSSVLGNVMDERETITMVTERYEALLGSEFCAESMTEKMDVEMALLGVLKDVMEDPASCLKRMLKDGLEDCIECWLLGEKSSKVYLYLVDEVTGCPLGSGYEVDVNEEFFKVLVPLVRLCLKSRAMDGTLAWGLSGALGLDVGDVPLEWREFGTLGVKCFEMLTDDELDGDEDPNRKEFEVFRDVLDEIIVEHGITKNESKDDDINDGNVDSPINLLKQWEAILKTLDPTREWGGLNRIHDVSADLVLWATPDGEDELKTWNESGINEFLSKREAAAVKKLEDIWNAKDDAASKVSSAVLSSSSSTTEVALRDVKISPLKIWNRTKNKSGRAACIPASLVYQPFMENNETSAKTNIDEHEYLPSLPTAATATTPSSKKQYHFRSSTEDSFSKILSPETIETPTYPFPSSPSNASLAESINRATNSLKKADKQRKKALPMGLSPLRRESSTKKKTKRTPQTYASLINPMDHHERTTFREVQDALICEDVAKEEQQQPSGYVQKIMTSSHHPERCLEDDDDERTIKRTPSKDLMEKVKQARQSLKKERQLIIPSGYESEESDDDDDDYQPSPPPSPAATKKGRSMAKSTITSPQPHNRGGKLAPSPSPAKQMVTPVRRVVGGKRENKLSTDNLMLLGLLDTPPTSTTKSSGGSGKRRDLRLDTGTTPTAADEVAKIVTKHSDDTDDVSDMDYMSVLSDEPTKSRAGTLTGNSKKSSRRAAPTPKKKTIQRAAPPIEEEEVGNNTDETTAITSSEGESNDDKKSNIKTSNKRPQAPPRHRTGKPISKSTLSSLLDSPPRNSSGSSSSSRGRSESTPSRRTERTRSSSRSRQLKNRDGENNGNKFNFDLSKSAASAAGKKKGGVAASTPRRDAATPRRVNAKNSGGPGAGTPRKDFLSRFREQMATPR